MRHCNADPNDQIAGMKQQLPMPTSTIPANFPHGQTDAALTLSTALITRYQDECLPSSRSQSGTATVRKTSETYVTWAELSSA